MQCFHTVGLTVLHATTPGENPIPCVTIFSFLVASSYSHKLDDKIIILLWFRLLESVSYYR
jgi:hypothetical protein